MLVNWPRALSRVFDSYGDWVFQSLSLDLNQLMPFAGWWMLGVESNLSVLLWVKPEVKFWFRPKCPS